MPRVPTFPAAAPPVPQASEPSFDVRFRRRRSKNRADDYVVTFVGDPTRLVEFRKLDADGRVLSVAGEARTSEAADPNAPTYVVRWAGVGAAFDRSAPAEHGIAACMCPGYANHGKCWHSDLMLGSRSPGVRATLIETAERGDVVVVS